MGRWSVNQSLIPPFGHEWKTIAMMWIHVAALRYRVNQNPPLAINKVCFRIFICVYIAYTMFGHPSLIWSILARIVSVTGVVFSWVPKTTKSTDSKPVKETETEAVTHQSTPSAALVSDLKVIVVNFFTSFLSHWKLLGRRHTSPIRMWEGFRKLLKERT